MKVLFINHMGFMGGGERSMLALMDGLKQTGKYTVCLMAPEGELLESARNKGHQIFPFNFGRIRRSYNPLVWIKGLAGLIKGIAVIKNVLNDKDIELVHANSLKAAIMGGLVARRAKRTMIFHTRDFLSAGLLGRPLITMAYKLSARVIVNSRSVAQIYGSDPQNKVAVVYNYVTSPEKITPERRKKIRAENGVTEKQPVVGYVGRLHPDKDIETLLKGFNVLLDSIPDGHLWIVGGAMPGEEKYQHLLENYADKLGISRKVVFFGWRNDATKLMSCFDVLVVPSKKEPFGRVTVEAMMLGIPVLATASGGTLEIIEDNKTGLLFNPGDNRQLAQKCLEILNDHAKTSRITDLAKSAVERKFNAERYIDGVEKVYGSLGRCMSCRRGG